jgi:selenocysteine lyase/cysteine desulfurase
MGIPPQTGAVRASLVHYNTIEEIGKFVDVLRRIPRN